MAKNDPERYMKEVLGVDPDTYAEERLARKYEISQMSPEAREAMELKQQLEQVKSRDSKAKQPIIESLKDVLSPDVFEQLQKEAPDATIEQLQNFAQQKKAEFQAGLDATSQELLDAWEKTGLPKQKDFGSWMAQVMVDHSKKSADHKKRTGLDLPPLQASEAAAKVKTRFLNSTKSLFGQMDAQAIQEALGPEIIQKLRAHDVERVSKPQTPPWASSAPATPPQPNNGKAFMSEIEYREWLKR